MKPEWFQLLYKTSDIVFDVPVGSKFIWQLSMYEPLIIGIAFPFIRVPPWQLRGTPKMFQLGKKMRKVWERSKMDWRHILRNVVLEYERLRSMPADVVLRVLYFECKCGVPCQESGEEEEERENDPQLQQRMKSAWGNKHWSAKDFLTGRDGDHLLIPFECNVCIFRKLKGRNPIPSNAQDLLPSACIRRMNLYMFWSQAKATF
jgi:hypothetical protein